MALEEFEENKDPKRKRYMHMKSIMDIGMGLIYILVGLVILFSRRMGFVNEFTDSTMGKIFAGLVIVYGGWRIFRGIRKDYFTDK